MTAGEVRDDEDDGYVFDLAVEHAIPFVGGEAFVPAAPRVAVPRLGVSTSAKISPCPSGSLTASARCAASPPAGVAVSLGSSSTWLRRSRDRAGVRRAR